MTSFAARVGERIRTLRLARGLNVVQLSKLSGVSGQNLSKYEAGNRIPRQKAAVKLAKALRVPPEALFGDTKMRLVRSEITPRAALSALGAAIRRLPALENIPIDILDALERLGPDKVRERLGIVPPVEPLEAGKFSRD